MAVPTTETGVVDAIIKAVVKRWPDSWTLKVHGGPKQRRGVPDLVMCVEGRFVGFEVKHKKPGESEAHARGRTSQSQLVELGKVARAKGLSATVLGAEEAVQLIEDHLGG